MDAKKTSGKKFKVKKLFRKKRFWVIAIAVVVVAGGAAFGISAKNRAKQAAAQTSVQSAEVEKGTVSNSVDASGNLEAATVTDVTVPSGVKIKEVKVESGDQVTKGQTLATLDKTSVTKLLVEVEESLDAIDDELDESGLSDYEEEVLEAEKSELKKERKKLKALRKSPKIKATADGVIGSVNVSEDAEASGSSSSDTSGSSSTSAALTQTSADVSSDTSAKAAVSEKNATADSSLGGTSSETTVMQLTAKKQTTGGSAVLLSSDTGSSAAQTETVITDYSGLSVTAPATGGTPQATIESTDSYDGTIAWDPADTTFSADTAYTATIVLTAKSGYTFSAENLPEISGAEVSAQTTGSGEKNVLTITAKFEATASDTSGTDNTSKAKSSGKSSGSASGTDGAASSGSVSGAASSGSTASAGISSGSVSGSSASSATASSTDSTSSSADAYGVDYVTAFTIEEEGDMKLSVSVDELDILSIAEGQTATVTLDALEDQSFEGSVTRVTSSSSSEGGNTKYTVEITVAKDENMRTGMSASATIQISQAENALIIPMTALQQRGEETFVYTEKDEDGNLSGETTVETGLSDGSNVEITSGLSEGDTVYYQGTSSDSSLENVMENMGQQPSGVMPSGGDAPSGGGNMPSGGGGNMPSGGGKSSGQGE